MSYLANAPDKNTTVEATTLANLTALSVSGVGEFLRKTGITSFENATLTTSGLVTGSGTINEIAYFNAASTIASLTVATYPSLTELSYLKGVSSALQTQLVLKAPLASPTFSTQIITPLIIGGTSTTSTLTYKTTTGVGTTNADHIFVGGNNGATELMRLSNAGELRIGQATTGSSRLTVVDSAHSSGYMSVFSVTQTSVNTSDTGDGVLNASYALVASSASDQLIVRGFNWGIDNTLTGGGKITNARCFNFATLTRVGTTTESLVHLYLETPAVAGTVTTGYGMYIAQLQGTTKYGIYDAVGTKWVNATTTASLVLGTTAADQILTLNAATTGDNCLISYKQNGTTYGYTGMGSDNAMRIQVVGNLPIIFNSNSLDRVTISGLGNIVLGTQSALATDATDGFTYIPTCAGAPTGAPTAYTGKVAIVFDTTNNNFYVYDGGWLKVALAA